MKTRFDSLCIKCLLVSAAMGWVAMFHMVEAKRYRIQFDGAQYFVQSHEFFGWRDDIWGGYFPSLESASNRVNELRAFDKKFERDWESKRRAKTITTFPYNETQWR